MFVGEGFAGDEPQRAVAADHGGVILFFDRPAHDFPAPPSMQTAEEVGEPLVPLAIPVIAGSVGAGNGAAKLLVMPERRIEWLSALCVTMVSVRLVSSASSAWPATEFVVALERLMGFVAVSIE
jgi:hypothetical protein